MGLYNMLVLTENGQLSLQFHSGVFLEDSSEEKYSQGAELLVVHYKLLVVIKF